MTVLWNVALVVGWATIALRLAYGAFITQGRGWRWLYAVAAYWACAHVIWGAWK